MRFENCLILQLGCAKNWNFLNEKVSKFGTVLFIIQNNTNTRITKFYIETRVFQPEASQNEIFDTFLRNLKNRKHVNMTQKFKHYKSKKMFCLIKLMRHRYKIVYFINRVARSILHTCTVVLRPPLIK